MSAKFVSRLTGWFLVLLLAGTTAATPVVLADAAACNDAIARGVQAVQRGRVAQLSRCASAGNYSSCNDADSHTVAHENELRHWVAEAGSACADAVAMGSVVGEFGPALCPAEWNDCDVAVPTVNDLDDLADCMLCGLRGYDLFVRDSAGLPRSDTIDRSERSCAKKLLRTSGRAYRKGFRELSRCAAGGEQPFNCPLDISQGTRFAKKLSALDRAATRCRFPEGRALAVLTNFCEGSAADADELASCLRARTICTTCRSGNLAFGQEIDCAALSASAACDGVF